VTFAGTQTLNSSVVARTARLRQASALLASALAAACAQAPSAGTGAAADDSVAVPRLWDDDALATWGTPLAGLGVPPSYATAANYYALPVDNLRTYPLYHPAHEPAGYRAWLLAQGAQPLIDPSRLRTRADWIAAGRRVFEELDTAASRTNDPAVLAYFGDPEAIDAHRDASHDVMTKDGVLLDYRWVVDGDGTLKVSFSSCFACHTRLMPDGTLLPGAPSNYDVASSPAVAVMARQLQISSTLSKGQDFYAQFGVPWCAEDPHARFATMADADIDKLVSGDAGAPPGTTFARFNGSPLSTTRMADLRGVRDRRYLDATGTHRNRGPEDIARYGILVEFVDVAVFGAHHMLPPDATLGRVRPPDEAMYALGLYLYSLDPAASPHPFDQRAERGRAVFAREGCADCHPPPLYTSNELIPAGDIGTDPTLALRSARVPGPTRCRRCGGCGTAACSSTTVRWRRWKTGSIPSACAPTTCPPGGAGRASSAALSPATSTVSTCRPTTRPRSSPSCRRSDAGLA